MHAFLFRKWKNNVKGRDWYDMEWYIKKGVTLHLSHFILRARDSGDWDKTTMTIDEFKSLLAARSDTVNMERVKDDIWRFIPNQDKLQIWSTQYFHDLADRLIINEK